MAHYKFKKDIIEGEMGEEFVTNCLCETFSGKLISTNKTNSHDVILEFPQADNSIWSGTLSLEIKTDLLVTKTRDTGNMFIEYECRGKPSGISVTKSDIFITYFKHLDELWAIPTSKLKELLSANDFKTVKNVGDKNSKTCGYLIPRMRYKEHFNRYKL
jgi:hypothetical protein